MREVATVGSGSRLGLFLDVAQHVDQHLDGAPLGRSRFVDELGDHRHALADRPRGLPDWPFLKRVCSDGSR